MRKTLWMIALVACSSSALAANVGVSISVGQPGFYGRIDVGGYPPPPVLYRQPVLIEPVVLVRPPIYLRVPPGHAKHWSKHCHEYRACGERVLFVQDTWYNREYAPRYRNEYPGYQDDYRGDERGDFPQHGHGKGHGRGHGRD